MADVFQPYHDWEKRAIDEPGLQGAATPVLLPHQATEVAGQTVPAGHPACDLVLASVVVGAHTGGTRYRPPGFALPVVRYHTAPTKETRPSPLPLFVNNFPLQSPRSIAIIA